MKSSCNVVVVAALFCVQRTIILAANGQDVCSGENSVSVDDACFVILRNRTSFDLAKENCNSTGGSLWKTSDRQNVFEKIKYNPNLTGFYWVDKESDITIDGLPVGKMCPPAIEFGSYDETHGLQMTMNLYTRSFLCWGRHAFICKYDFHLERKAFHSIYTSAHVHVPMSVLTIVSVLAFLLLLALLITLVHAFLRRQQYRKSKVRNISVSSTENPDMYDAPWASPGPGTSSPQQYDFPLEVNDIKEQKTLMGGAKMPRLKFPWLDSDRKSAQVPVARTCNHRENEKYSKSKKSVEVKNQSVADIKDPARDKNETEKGKIKDKGKAKAFKKGTILDSENRKVDERQKQHDLGREIERQRDISNKRHHAAHKYTYIGNEEKADGHTEENLYEPVHVFEKNGSC